MEIRLDAATDWAKARIVLDGARQLDSHVLKAILAELQYLRKKIVETFDQEGPSGKKWPALSPVTLAIRKFEGFKGTKMLQVTRDLVGSIAVVEMKGEGGFVGVARSKARKDGKDPVNIALAQEQGFETKVAFSAKQRRYLFAALAAAGMAKDPPAGAAKGSGATTVLIRVPPRPFLAPAFETYGKPEDVARSIQARVARSMANALGRPDGGGAPRE
jgi:hypothetical protein